MKCRHGINSKSCYICLNPKKKHIGKGKTGEIYITHKKMAAITIFTHLKKTFLGENENDG